MSRFDFLCRPESLPHPSFRPKPRIYPGPERKKSFIRGTRSKALYRKDFSAPRLRRSGRNDGEGTGLVRRRKSNRDTIRSSNRQSGAVSTRDRTGHAVARDPGQQQARITPGGGERGGFRNRCQTGCFPRLPVRTRGAQGLDGVEFRTVDQLYRQTQLLSRPNDAGLIRLERRYGQCIDRSKRQAGPAPAPLRPPRRSGPPDCRAGTQFRRRSRLYRPQLGDRHRRTKAPKAADPVEPLDRQPGQRSVILLCEGAENQVAVQRNAVRHQPAAAGQRAPGRPQRPFASETPPPTNIAFGAGRPLSAPGAAPTTISRRGTPSAAAFFPASAARSARRSIPTARFAGWDEQPFDGDRARAGPDVPQHFAGPRR